MKKISFFISLFLSILSCLTFSFSTPYILIEGPKTTSSVLFYANTSNFWDNYNTCADIPISCFTNDAGYVTAFGAETDPFWTANQSSYATLAFVIASDTLALNKIESLPNLSYANINSNMGNWSNDKASYALITFVTSNDSAYRSVYNASYLTSETDPKVASMPNLSYANINSNMGNWSNDKASYALLTFVTSNDSAYRSVYNASYLTSETDPKVASLPNLSYANINSNMGNWSNDKASYALLTFVTGNDSTYRSTYNASYAQLAVTPIFTADINITTKSILSSTKANITTNSSNCVIISGATGTLAVC